MKSCNSCGKCCLKYGHGGLSASVEDIEGWELFNPELFEYVRDGNIWFDPSSGRLIEYCPWLKRQTQDDPEKQALYTCDIYHNRPEDCRHYPSTVEEMVRDECEMIEVKDLSDISRAQRDLDRLMMDSRPPLR